MSNAKNINEVSVITSVDSGDYVMVSDISDDSLKRATVTNVGKELLGTTDISSIGDGSVTGAISTINSGTIAGGTIAKTSDLSNYLPKSANYNQPLTGDLWIQGNGNRTVVIGNQSAGATGYLQLSNNNHYGLLYPLNLTGDRQYRLPDNTGTMALTNNLPQIISLYGSTPTQSNITLPVPSGFTPLLLYILTSNSSGSTASRSLFTLPVGMYGYIPLNVGGTSEYIRLESAVSGSTYSLNFLGSSGSTGNTFIQQVKALGYYS